MQCLPVFLLIILIILSLELDYIKNILDYLGFSYFLFMNCGSQFSIAICCVHFLSALWLYSILSHSICLLFYSKRMDKKHIPLLIHRYFDENESVLLICFVINYEVASHSPLLFCSVR